LVDVPQRIVRQILRLDLRVLQLHIQLSDNVCPLPAAGLSELPNVATEGLGEHILVQAGKLHEDLIVEELLGQRVRFHL
jgi:hypothetical protein